jgi:hypothetical protein
VPRVVTTLKPRNHIGALRQPINNLAFTFVAPLRADDYHICHPSDLSHCVKPASV